MATSRREFLQALGATGVSLAGLTACGGGGGGSSSSGSGGGQPATPIPSAPLLVVVQIEGGNDWLNMMVPTTGANRTAYEANRTTLRIDASQTTDLGSGVGLNKDFTGMDQLSALGRVAWVAGIGMNNPNLSHFTSIDLWGQGYAGGAATGWLGRYADAAFSASDAIRGMTLTSDLPLMLQGANKQFVSVPNVSGFRFPTYLQGNATIPDTALLSANWSASLAAACPDPAILEGYSASAAAGQIFYDAETALPDTLPARTPSVLYPGDAGYPVTRGGGGALDGSLAFQLKLIAQMIAANLPIQVFYARLSGWDTHSNQAVDHPDLMRALGGSLKAFYDDLATISTSQGNAQDRVMVMGWSEFGRRVPENQGGTDHGTAGLAFCLGRAVKGGLYGAYPNLADLDANKNMKFSTDYRSLYATVLDRWLAGNSASVLGASYPKLGFI